MATQMYELFDLVESVESTMENICTLATSLHVSKDIIVNFNVTKLSLVECKNSLVTFGHQEYNINFLEKLTPSKLGDKQDIKPIKVENTGFEVKPDVLNIKDDPPGKDIDEESIQLSPKRFEEIIGLADEDFQYLNYDDGSAYEIKDGGRGLEETCRVCGEPASENKNYGAISCFSCKAFFRRGQPQVSCILNNDECIITKETRVKCKSCRYKKCLDIGMMPEKVKVRRAIPEKENDFDDDNSEEETKKVRKRKKKVPGQKRVTELNDECRVCGAPAPTHLNYGAIACFSCRAFFRRGRPKNRCINSSNKCKITATTKAGCPSCRYNKCLVIGMEPGMVNTKNPEKNQADVTILNDYPMDDIENNPYNVNNAYNSDDDNNEGNDAKPMEKPEEPSIQAKAETFVEYMKTQKKNDSFILQDVVNALQNENYHYFSNVKEKDGDILKQCSICKDSKRFLSEPNHVKNHFNFYPCKVCGQWLLQFLQPSHKEQNHWRRCRDCSHPVKNLENHTCSHRVIASGLKCEICGESFLKPAKLNLHKLTKHSNKNFICDICGRTDFEHVMAYRRHMKGHTDQTFTCHVCKAQFKKKSELKNHKKNEHLDVIGQFCDICGIVVPSLKTHNKFKHMPVNCEICGKQFGDKYLLTKHIQGTHEKSLIVQCDVCNKEFSCKSSLAKHLKRVHKMNITQKEIPLKVEKF